MKISNIIENVVLRLAALIGASIFIISRTYDALISSNDVNIEVFKMVLIGLNLLILTAFTLLSAGKIPKLKFRTPLTEHKLNYCEIFGIGKNLNNTDKRDLADLKNSRVNKLVKQLNTNILYYCIFLIIVYLLYIVDNDHKSELHKYYHIIQDIFNYLSAVFVYLAFKVLHDKTLDEENNKTNYYVDAIIFSIIFIASYLIFIGKASQISMDEVLRKHLYNFFGLLSGLANGVAMTLLFGKFRSIEQSIGRIDKIKPINFTYFGTAIILPVYTLVQPLFGSFEIDAFGNPKIFANIVFLLCLIGKAFFLYFSYTFTKDKLFHLHMHMIITSQEIPAKSDRCFDIFNTNEGKILIDEKNSPN